MGGFHYCVCTQNLSLLILFYRTLSFSPPHRNLPFFLILLSLHMHSLTRASLLWSLNVPPLLALQILALWPILPHHPHINRNTNWNIAIYTVHMRENTWHLSFWVISLNTVKLFFEKIHLKHNLAFNCNSRHLSSSFQASFSNSTINCCLFPKFYKFKFYLFNFLRHPAPQKKTVFSK